MPSGRKMTKFIRLISVSLLLALLLIPGDTEVVRADTEVTIQPSAADAFIYSADPNHPYGAQTTIMTYAYKTTLYIMRSPIKFDIASSIPAGATITSAKLYLRYYGYNISDGTENAIIGLHKVQQSPARDWVEAQVTWNSYKTGSAWTNAGGDFSGTASASATVPKTPTGVWIEWTSDQLKADVQDFLDNSSTNYGWVLKDSNEGWGSSPPTYRIREFLSNNCGDPSLKPKLVVTYVINPPTVTTQDADGVTTTTATLHGNVTDTGGENPTRYFDWDTDSGEPYANTEDCGVGGTGAYEKEITGLTPGQTYYFRARAGNSGGTRTGDEKSFTTIAVTIDITAPDSTTITLDPRHDEDTKDITLTVDSNVPSWTVKAQDLQTVPELQPGHMTKYSEGVYVTGVYLANAMVVEAVGDGTATGDWVTLPNAVGDPILTGNQAVTNHEYTIYFKQTVLWTDDVVTAPDCYRIVVTFTGSAP